MANTPNLRVVPKGGDLASLGFREISPDPDYRVVASSTAGEKSGKTHFAFTFPDPIAVISNDTGTEPVAKKFIRGQFGKRKDIRIRSFASAKDLLQDNKAKDAATKEWEGVVTAIKGVVENPKVRSLIIDTGTGAWELCRLARLGKLQQVMPHHYVDVNAEFSALVTMAYERRDLNMLWIHKTKKEYKTNSQGKDNWTGRMERSGFNDMPFLVDCNLRQFFNQNRVDHEGNPLPPTFATQVIDSREEMLSAVGTILEGDFCNFQMLAETLFPETAGSGIWE